MYEGGDSREEKRKGEAKSVGRGEKEREEKNKRVKI